MRHAFENILKVIKLVHALYTVLDLDLYKIMFKMVYSLEYAAPISIQDNASHLDLTIVKASFSNM